MGHIAVVNSIDIGVDEETARPQADVRERRSRALQRRGELR
jgi:hypothetical protein